MPFSDLPPFPLASISRACGLHQFDSMPFLARFCRTRNQVGIPAGRFRARCGPFLCSAARATIAYCELQQIVLHPPEPSAVALARQAMKFGVVLRLAVLENIPPRGSRTRANPRTSLILASSAAQARRRTLLTTARVFHVTDFRIADPTATGTRLEQAERIVVTSRHNPLGTASIASIGRCRQPSACGPARCVFRQTLKPPACRCRILKAVQPATTIRMIAEHARRPT